MAHSAAAATALAALENGVQTSSRIKLHDIAGVNDGAITSAQVANVLQSLHEQCKSETKKLTLGCRVSTAKGKVTWKMVCSLPNVQRVLVRFFSAQLPMLTGRLHCFHIFFNPVAGEMMIPGNKTSTCPMWWFSAVKPSDFTGPDLDIGKLWIAKDLSSDGIQRPSCYLKVLEVDPRHPMTFCKEAKPLVWVLAECLVLTENMQMPNEVKVKMDAMGYALKNEPGFRCGQLPNETSHQFVETASKLKIAANIFRKQHRKRQAPKPAQKCPHCGKEIPAKRQKTKKD